MKLTTFAIVGLAMTGSSAMAAEITGGSIKLEYSAFTDETDFSRVGIEGSLEVAFNRNFSVQADLGYQSFNETDLDSNVYGLHGIYHLDDDTSFGIYYTKDDTDLGDLDIVGVEVGHEMSNVELEAYLAYADADVADGALFGLSGRYEFENTVGITGSFDRFDEGSIDANVLTVAVDYDVTPNVNLFLKAGGGEIGIDGFGSTDFEGFVGVGAKIAFGNKRGATFEQRSLTKFIPGL